MRILFDHGPPRDLARALPEHEVTKTNAMGWEQFTNGALLKEAEEQGFNLFLTTDNNIRYQQNLTNRKIHHSFDRLHKMVAGTAAFRAYSGRSERSHTRELYRSRNSFRLDSRKG